MSNTNMFTANQAKRLIIDHIGPVLKQSGMGEKKMRSLLAEKFRVMFPKAPTYPVKHTQDRKEVAAKQTHELDHIVAKMKSEGIHVSREDVRDAVATKGRSRRKVYKHLREIYKDL